MTTLRTVASPVAGAAEPRCMIIVNGKLEAGGHPCGHLESRHIGPTWDGRCLDCKAEGIGATIAVGPRKRTGFDHAHLNSAGGRS